MLAYNSEHAKVEDGLIRITQGYSRDHRPALNQVVIQMIADNQAGLPLMMTALSGNADDQSHFRETVTGYVNQRQNAVGTEIIVADSALHTAATLPTLHEITWLTRVPAKLKAAAELIDLVGPELLANSTEQTGYRTLSTTYAGVRQRWIIVFSPDAYRRALTNVVRGCKKDSQADCKVIAQLQQQRFACKDDAQSALNKAENQLIISTIENTKLIEQPYYQGKGRPAKDRQPDGYQYRIEVGLASSLVVKEQRLTRKSCYILATNHLGLDTGNIDDFNGLMPANENPKQTQTTNNEGDSQDINNQYACRGEALATPSSHAKDKVVTAAQLITTYKDQQQVEPGFQFLKDPQFMATNLYLKSVKRVMALTLVMGLCLLIYAALQYRIRNVLQASGASFPNQRGKRITNPTARWIFQAFKGIHVLVLAHLETHVLNLKDYQQTLLALLGQPYVQLYPSYSKLRFFIKRGRSRNCRSVASATARHADQGWRRTACRPPDSPRRSRSSGYRGLGV